MAKVKKLRHVAAGLLGSFVSRNNNVDGYWAIGVLYLEAAASDNIVQLRLLEREAAPPSATTMLVASNYAEFLRRALIKQLVEWEELAAANIDLQFDTAPDRRDLECRSAGDPFVCTVTIQSKRGEVACVKASGRCVRHEAGLFSQRG